MATINVPNRSLYCHDNLEVLRGINSESIDLIYLDPPFNKDKKFIAPIGSSAEGASFTDIFREEDVKDEWIQTIKEDHDALYAILQAVRQIGGGGGRTSTALYDYCYLAYMAIRLIECYRVLKQTGSIYLHCDQTMSHGLKLVMDAIWGSKYFLNEVIWYYKNASRGKKQFAKSHDTLLWYGKSKDHTFNRDEILAPFESGMSAWRYAVKGLEAPKGKTPDDVFMIQALNANDKKERTGYPTQKPLALLQRIIIASSKEGDVVLDPFCGCATSCVAAEAERRQWIGIDISQKAYELVRERIEDTDGLLVQESDYNFSTSPPKRTDDGAFAQKQKHVYIISNPRHPDRFKVGIAGNPKSRLNQYQTSDPDRAFKLEYSIPTPHYRELEAYIHRKRDNQMEWVRGPVEDIKVQMTAYLKEKGSERSAPIGVLSLKFWMHDPCRAFIPKTSLAFSSCPSSIPCIGICSTTSVGDPVCRGCFRLDSEVVQWPEQPAHESRAILTEIFALQRQQLQEWLRIDDEGLLDAALRRQHIRWNAVAVADSPDSPDPRDLWWAIWALLQQETRQVSRFGRQQTQQGQGLGQQQVVEEPKPTGEVQLQQRLHALGLALLQPPSPLVTETADPLGSFYVMCSTAVWNLRLSEPRRIAEPQEEGVAGGGVEGNQPASQAGQPADRAARLEEPTLF